MKHLRSCLYIIALTGFCLLCSCKKSLPYDPLNAEEKTSFANHGADFLANAGTGGKTLGELLQARAATIKYRDINKALADQYKETPVVIQNMGFHFLKADNVSSVFNPARPAFL